MRITILSWLLLTLLLVGCKHKDVTSHVDPFIGTGAHGHTYPGAAMPFGMVQLSPDTRNDNSWDGCSGYHYSDSAIVGFSHTHLSGTGVPEYCDVLFLPHTGRINLNPGTRAQPATGYRSGFRHETEAAKPGYYKVTLDDYKVDVELTTTTRVGLQRYRFNGNEPAKVLVDLIHRDEVSEASLEIDKYGRLLGNRHSKDWAGNQKLFFASEFSTPFESIEVYKNGKSVEGTLHHGKRLQLIATFPKGVTEVMVKTALSSVDTKGAINNLETELNHWNFEAVQQNALDVWAKNLGKLDVEGGSHEDLTNFYSAWYHCLLTPNVFSDVDGRYRGMDGKIHVAEGYTHYTVFSLWDTFRNLHPLLTITHPAQASDFVRSLIDKGEQFGTYPMWELANNDTRCMIGYHAVSVIADAYAKGITDFDTEKALKLMLATANSDRRGLKDYREKGYVPANKSSQSVSKTLEYAYNDWCIAQFAKATGHTDVYNEFVRRSKFYQNKYDAESGFMRPKFYNGEWLANFDPTSVGYHYTEGNAFQYSFFVPHDVYGLMELCGGSKRFEKWLDSIFKTEITEVLHAGTDVTGLIGNYAHGNEPSHHIAWLYAWTGNQQAMTDRVRQIMQEQYAPTPGGICGNEDCGQMSAWYVMSAIGLFSVSPGVADYVVGLPYFPAINIRLDNGETFRIETNGPSMADETTYAVSRSLNGESFTASIIDHKRMLEGGTLSFTTGVTPGNFDLPENKLNQKFTANPYVKAGDTHFLGRTVIELACATPGAEVYYTLDGSMPDKTAKRYSQPIDLTSSKELKVIAYAEGRLPSYVTTVPFVKSSGAANVKTGSLRKGLICNYYEGIYRSVYDFEADKPAETAVVSNFQLGLNDRDEWLGMSFKGYIKITKKGLYAFEVHMNDGGQLKIDGIELFESDGRKTKTLAQSGTIWLSEGLHPIELGFYQCSDDIDLKFFWQAPGKEKSAVPEEILFN